MVLGSHRIHIRSEHSSSIGWIEWRNEPRKHSLPWRLRAFQAAQDSKLFGVAISSPPLIILQTLSPRSRLMKPKFKSYFICSSCLFLLLLMMFDAKAALQIPSNSSDGSLVVTEDTVIDLSLATDGLWDDDNSANAGNGIYDSEKWAVVFHYSSVNVAAGATVTFANHPSRAPVVWLVDGNVTIDGVVNLSGKNFVWGPGIADGGPGGFRSGSGYFTPGVGSGAGFGPGGATRASNGDGRYGGGGSYGTFGDWGHAVYGNPSLLPLIGGSGGGGGQRETPDFSGGGGGGAILIASAEVVAISGSVIANGGRGANNDQSRYTGGGSGGGIRIVCMELQGDGKLEAAGGSGYRSGGLGRIRLERVTNANTLQIVPDSSVVSILDEDAPLIWLPTDGPVVRIVSIGGVAAPTDPLASFDASGPDIAIPQTSATEVQIETTNVEAESAVYVRVTPRSNGDFTEVQAGSPEVLNSDPLTIRWSAEIPVTSGNSAVQVRVKRP